MPKELVLPPLIIIARIMGIVFPPFAGGTISFLALPFLNWFCIFIFDATGGIIGSLIAFILARRYGYGIVSRFIKIDKLKSWEAKISENQKFFGFLILRFVTGPISDYISYIAGLSSISLRSYFLATCIQLIIDRFFVFYFLNLGFNVNLLLLPGLIMPIGISYFVYRKFGRKFLK